MLHLFFEQGDQRITIRQQILQFADTYLQLRFFFGIFASIQACHLGQCHRGDHIGLDWCEFIGCLDLFARHCAIFCLLEDFDDAVRVGRADDQPLDNVQALPGFAHVKLRAARDDINLVGIPIIEQFDHTHMFGMARGLHRLT